MKRTHNDGTDDANWSGSESDDIQRSLLDSRIILLDSDIDDVLTARVVSSLLYLNSAGDEDITLVINSPGGDAYSGQAIMDTMKLIIPDVVTICIGQASSMAAFLLAAGTPKKRLIGPRARVMIHSVRTAASGTVHDVERDTKETKEINAQLLRDFAAHTGQSYKKVVESTKRDTWFSADAAIEYGIVDGFIGKLK